MSDKTEISVLGRDEGEDRGLREFLLRRREIDVDKLKKDLQTFLGHIESIVSELPAAVSGFGLDSVELSVEVSAKGKVSLLGSGGEMGGKGGLTFTLRRKD